MPTKISVSVYIYFFRNLALFATSVMDGEKWDRFVDRLKTEIANDVRTDNCMHSTDDAKLALRLEVASGGCSLGQDYSDSAQGTIAMDIGNMGAGRPLDRKALSNGEKNLALLSPAELLAAEE